MSVSRATVADFRSRWANDLPEGWRFAKFGEVLRPAKRPVKLLDDQEYIQPVIRRGHAGIEVRDRQFGRDIKTKAQFQIRAGDWLMSKVQILHGAYGVVPPALDGAIASGTYFVFRPEPVLDIRYLWYLSHLRPFHDSCAVASVGVVIEKMVFRAEDWKLLEFPLPPVPEQKKIAAVLSSVDEAIHATQLVVDQTRQVKEGLLQDLLTHGLPGHTRFKQTDIGKIPESWEVVPFASICTDTRLGTGARGTDDAESLPLLKMGNLGWGYLNLIDLEPIAASFVVEDDLLATGDLLFNTRNTVDLVGKCAVWRGGLPTVYDNNILRVRFIKSVLPEIVAYQISCLSGRQRMRAIATGSTSVAAIYWKDLSKLKIGLPPLAEQREILRVMGVAEETQVESQVGLEHLRQLKAGLLQDLLTGKVRVSP